MGRDARPPRQRGSVCWRLGQGASAETDVAFVDVVGGRAAVSVGEAHLRYYNHSDAISEVTFSVNRNLPVSLLASIRGSIVFLWRGLAPWRLILAPCALDS
jgi:hypothetical protein